RMALITSSLRLLTLIGWWLLIARVVHAETLVGDRQFWITRPYEWQKLLAAKVLFAVAWIGVSYLLAEFLMLAEAGYSPLTYPPGLLLNLLGVGTVFLLPLFSLATVTANFARLTLTLLACLAIFVGSTFLTDGIVRSSYTSANPYTNWLLYPLLFCGCALAIALQYATRPLRRSVSPLRRARAIPSKRVRMKAGTTSTYPSASPGWPTATPSSPPT